MKHPETRNPFAVQTPEDISASDIVSLFVNVFTDFSNIPKPGHTFLNGPRGCGKSMMFRYLEPDCQQLADGKALHDLSFFGVYVPIKNTELKLTELKRLENRHANLVLNEHFLVTYIAIRLFAALSTVQLVNDHPSSSAVREYHQNDLRRALQRSGWSGQMEALAEDQGVSSIFSQIRELFSDEYAAVLSYVRRLAFSDQPVSYSGPLFGYLDFLLPLMKGLKKFAFMPQGPIFLLIDDADNLNVAQTRILNSWVSSRTSAIVSLKISTQLNYKTFLTTTGHSIDSPHDFSEINISSVYTSQKDRYLDRVSEIVSKRLEMHGIKKSPAIFFPPAKEQEARITEIGLELKEKWATEGRGYRASDDMVRYARPMYITGLLGTRKSGSTYKYAGFSQLVHISSGIIRYFLESASLMYGEVRSMRPDSPVESIAPEIQDRIVREQVDQFLFAEFDRWSTDEVGKEEANVPRALDTTRKLRNLIQALGGTFHQILISDASERRVFSVALSDELTEDVLEVFKLGVQYGYFHESSIGNKEGTGRTRLYVLTRRLAPFFLLDPTSFAGYKFVTNDLLREAMLKPKTFVGKIRRRGVDAYLQSSQLDLFGEGE